jgi:hypothetical protein
MGYKEILAGVTRNQAKEIYATYQSLTSGYYPFGKEWAEIVRKSLVANGVMVHGPLNSNTADSVIYRIQKKAGIKD